MRTQLTTGHLRPGTGQSGRSTNTIEEDCPLGRHYHANALYSIYPSELSRERYLDKLVHDVSQSRYYVQMAVRSTGMDSSADSVSSQTAPPRVRPSFIDLFAGCGGLSLGLMNAGWRGILAVEKCDLAFATLKHNLIDGKDGTRPAFDWPDWLPREAQSVRSFGRKFASEIRTHLSDRVDLIAGGPPCQGFSLAGGRSPDDPRNLLWRDYLGIVEMIRPRLVLLENVNGIAIKHGRTRDLKSAPRRGRRREPHAQRIGRALENRGYTVYHDLILAADYGVPQLRPRYLMAGLRIPPGTPRPEDIFDLLRCHREEFVATHGLRTDRYVSMKQAISDLERTNGTYKGLDRDRFLFGLSSGPRTAYQRLMSSPGRKRPPDSHRFPNHTKLIVKRFRRMMRECPRGVKIRDAKLLGYGTHKLSFTISDPDQPSHTLTTLPDDILHYSEPRILTVREYARIQSFPDWFEFQGKYTTGGKLRTKECPRYTQAGNAVPPLLGEALGGVLADVLPLTVREVWIPETSLTPATYAKLESVAESAKQSQPVGTPAA